MNTNCHCHYPGGHHHQQPARKMTLVTGPLHWPMASGGHWPGHTGAAAFLHCETLYNTHCTGSYIFTKLHYSSELGLVGKGLVCLTVIWFGLVWFGWVHGWQYSGLPAPGWEPHSSWPHLILHRWHLSYIILQPNPPSPFHHLLQISPYLAQPTEIAYANHLSALFRWSSMSQPSSS